MFRDVRSCFDRIPFEIHRFIYGIAVGGTRAAALCSPVGILASENGAMMEYSCDGEVAA